MIFEMRYPDITKKRPLDIFCYGIGLIEGYELPDNHSEIMILLKEWGLNVCSETALAHDVKGCMDFYHYVIDKRHLFDYDIDGLVYKVNNLNNTDLGNDELIEFMIQFPKIIERPILDNGIKAVIGRPPEKILELLV